MFRQDGLATGSLRFYVKLLYMEAERIVVEPLLA